MVDILLTRVSLPGKQHYSRPVYTHLAGMISHIISVIYLVSAFHSEQQESPWHVILGIGLRITWGMKGTAKDRCPRGLTAATKGNFYIMTLPQAKNASSLNSFPWKCSHFLHIFWLYLSLFKLAWGKNIHVNATSYLIYKKRERFFCCLFIGNIICDM